MADSGTFDEGIAAQRLATREKLALAMIQQGNAGAQTSTVSNGRITVAASPFQHLNALMQGVRGQQSLDSVDKGYADLSAGHKATITDAIAKYQAATAGTPEIAAGADDKGGGPGRPAMPADPAKAHSAIIDLLANQSPEVQRLGGIEHSAAQQRDVLAEQAKARQATYNQTQADKAETARKERELKVQLELLKQGYGAPGAPPTAPAATPPPNAAPPASGAVQPPGGMVVPPDVQAGRDKIAAVLRNSETQPNGGGLIPTSAVIPGSAPPPAAPLNQAPATAPGTSPGAAAPTGEPVFSGNPKQQAEARNRWLQAQETAKAKAAAVSDMTPEAVDNAATKYRQTGNLPSMGMGGMAAKVKILNRAAEMAALDGSNAEAESLRAATFKAGQTALTDLTKREQQVAAFEKTFVRNTELVQELSAKTHATGVPLLNKWINSGKRALAGDPQIVALDAAIKGVSNEYAKIVSGSMGNTATAEGEIKKTEALLNSAQTPEQILSVIATMKRETQNRMSGFHDQKQEIMNGLKIAPTAPVSGGGAKVLKFDAQGNPI